MFEFEVIDELMLRATCIDGGGCIYTKAGAMIAHQGNNKFDKVLLGPEGNAVKALFGQVAQTDPLCSPLRLYSCYLQ